MDRFMFAEASECLLTASAIYEKLLIYPHLAVCLGDYYFGQCLQNLYSEEWFAKDDKAPLTKRINNQFDFIEPILIKLDIDSFNIYWKFMKGVLFFLKKDYLAA